MKKQRWNKVGTAQPFPLPNRKPRADIPREKIELNKLDRALRQKLEIDKPYNMLRILDRADALVIDMPVFRGPMLDASAEEILQPSNLSRVFGSCAFELASVLQLLPGQPRAGLMETKTCSFQQLFYDTDTYYAKCSRDDLFRLITQHFSSIKESSGHLVIKTSIGTFTLIQTDRLLVVKVNGRERAATAIAPPNQDYPSLKKCAAGLWSLHEENHTDETHQVVLPGTVQDWTSFPNVAALLFIQNIDHKNCLYFFPEEEYQEIQLRLQCALDLGDTLLWLYERETTKFAWMLISFESYEQLIEFRVWHEEVLARQVTIVNSMLTQALSLTLTCAEDAPHRASLGDVSQFLNRCLRFHNTLFSAYRLNPTQATLQTLLIDALEDKQLVAGQLALAFLYRGNAGFILHRAVSSPRSWLDIITAVDGEVYVG
jgi:hypothetical protein